MRAIKSRENAQYKALRRLVESSRERRKSGLSVLDGPHLVRVYSDRVGAPEQVVVSVSGLADHEIRSLAERLSSSPAVVLSDALFNDISPVVSPTGIIAIVKTPRPITPPRRFEPCLMLEGLQDPGNLGSILRTAAATGLRQIFLSENTVHAWSPRVLRAGMGAHFMLQVYEGVDLAAAASAFPGSVLAATTTARRSLFEIDVSDSVAFLFGNEGAGLSSALRRKAHAEFSLPMPGGTESINVSAAVAACLYERVRQIQAKHPS